MSSTARLVAAFVSLDTVANGLAVSSRRLTVNMQACAYDPFWPEAAVA